ncbi:hypothetical protein [Azospirillum sp.]|uniref:hypothetical protein n=1 Tax=Azospirillum sp. TaxID=34012 RepID=UPI002D26708C|nr:hypothetical protein [Azospirillum sp.]HYD70836.1 hypothetical protein [Azospirillum sp.]
MFVRTTVSALLACAALGLSVANAADGDRKGEVCVKQDGVYLAEVTWIFVDYRKYMARRILTNPYLLIGQTDCREFKGGDDYVMIRLYARLGNTVDCRIPVGSRNGRLTAVASGTTLNVNLSCP